VKEEAGKTKLLEQSYSIHYSLTGRTKQENQGRPQTFNIFRTTCCTAASRSTCFDAQAGSE
jgi:hypothetical protein